MLPPHYWATADKATPSRTTNQAVLIVARSKDGKPCLIPVEAPAVYTEFKEASYDMLAKQILNGISDHFGTDALSQLCGVAADGPYQARGFKEYFRQALGLNDDEDIALPITWDTAHLLNLAVTDVRDSNTKSGSFFRQFIKRCNVFNHVLANGKGFAFLEMVDKNARRPVSYATQRFASSSFEQWIKIEKSFESFWKAFDHLHLNRSEEEEWQYMIGGSDFVCDLLALLDILQPVVELMLSAQSLDTPVWKLKLWWSKVEAQLKRATDGDPQFFKRMNDVKPDLQPGGVFKGVELLPGWLILKDDGRDAGKDRFTWQMREESDVIEDHKRFAKDLVGSLEKRIQSVLQDEVMAELEVFDAANLVNLHCGTSVGEKITFFRPDGEVEEYGVEQCKKLMKVVSKLPHIRSSGLNFDLRMAHSYMDRLKRAVQDGIWKRLCPEWFNFVNDRDKEEVIPSDMLVEIRPKDSVELQSMYVLQFSSGKSCAVKLNESCFYESFYSNKDLYEIAKPPTCVLLDIALAKGRPEAIAESFYNSMRNQQQSGGQANVSLVRRTKVNWCLPSISLCENIIKESVSLYLKGDKHIKPHRVLAFFSSRANQYDVSKVVDRVNTEEGRCPFLAD